METKKSKKANLENKKGLFFQIGVVLALSAILVAFEWTHNPSKELNDMSYINDIEFEEQMMATKREEPKPPEIKQPEIKTVIEIVDDEFEVEDWEGFDMEVNDDTEYNFVIDDDSGEELIEDDTPFYIVEDMPKFNGGNMTEFWKYAMKNIRYPEQAAENGVSGTVHMQFTVNKSGDVVDVKVVKGVHPALDEEAIRVIKNSPKWEAGKQRGRAVNVIMSLPMKFILQ
jgi:protein TonB